MKKFLLLLLLIPSLAYGAAGDVANINGKAITAVATVAGKANAAILTIAGKPCSDGDASCTTSNDSLIYAPTSTGSSSSTVAIKAQKFVIASQITVTAYKINIQDNNQTGSLKISIMGHDSGGDYPDETNEISGSDVTVAASGIPDTAAVTEFALSTPLVLSAGTYWVCTQSVSGLTYALYYATSAGDRLAYANTLAEWSDALSNTAYNIEVWGCE